MLKKFLQEFKAFALKGNVMDLAIGVIIGAAFQDIVTSLTESFINPLINCIGGAEVAGKIKLGDTGQALNYGAFLTAVINFIIMAFVLFLLMKGINTIMQIGRKKEDDEKKEPVQPEPSKEEVLLTEIRDLLKAQANSNDSEKAE
ncbi:MAG: large conductance mechanosensitive channel protein MscL [Ruminococcus sp.]|nr:large conductance mechanosensitive channel protein MscL [Ruminococcus sp.]MDE6102441.1 large conductance mechanosensitive channel protein MscL [Ruminococcus sp.]